jgi:hypothetical protein
MNRALLKGIGAIALICGLGFPAYAETYGDFEYTIHGGSVTITKYTGSAARVTIPESINGLPVAGIGGRTYVGRYYDDAAFERCSTLTSVTIPASVASIGHGAFAGCFSLTSITVDGRNPVYSSYNGVLFDKQMQTLIRYPEGKSESSYAIPGSVLSIEIEAFAYCDNLNSVTIPASVASIGVHAFSRCARLTSITIPAEVAYIGDGAFWNCNSLNPAVRADIEKRFGLDVFEYGIITFR